jgi:hypothetical protein
VGGADEAAGAGDVHDGEVGLVEQVAGALEAELEVVLRRGAAHVAAKEALELAAREADILGQLLLRQRVLDVGFHQLDRHDELGMVDAEADADRHALAVVRPADAIEEALLADLGRELVAVGLGDAAEHQVEGGVPPEQVKRLRSIS